MFSAGTKTNERLVIDGGKDPDEVRAWRIGIYEDDLLFTRKEAEQLADARDDTTGQPVDYRVVKKAIEGGCGHKLAIRIFT